MQENIADYFWGSLFFLLMLGTYLKWVPIIKANSVPQHSFTKFCLPILQLFFYENVIEPLISVSIVFRLQ